VSWKPHWVNREGCWEAGEKGAFSPLGGDALEVYGGSR
jgi:hypothetical protein